MRVLYYGPFHKKRYQGGIWSISQDIKNNLHLFKERDVFIDFFSNSQIERTDKSKGKINLSNLRNFYKIKNNLTTLIKAKSYDVLHFNTSGKMAFLKEILLIKHLRNIYSSKIILHIHSSGFKKIFFNYNFLNKFIINKINKYIDLLIVLSESFKEELIIEGVKSEKVIVLYNFQNFITNKFNVFNNNSVKRLLFLGSINREKGILDLINAVSKINKDEYILNVAGKFIDSKTKKEILYFVKQNNLEKNIIFLGYIQGKGKKDILLNSDIMILPSYREGLPISILEGMAAGCAIIATEVGSIPEIIKKGENGFLFKPGNIDELRKYIENLLNNKVLLNKMKYNNICESEKYNINSFAENLVYIYKS